MQTPEIGFKNKTTSKLQNKPSYSLEYSGVVRLRKLVGRNLGLLTVLTEWLTVLLECIDIFNLCSWTFEMT